MARPVSTRHVQALQRLFRLSYSAVRHGALPAGPKAVKTAYQEGVEDLHWKVLGDALVRFCVHAGPVLTKLGQIMATRTDVLPPSVCARLEALYADQPPMAARDLKRILARAYPKARPFRTFDFTPLAGGSVGQVHPALLRDGREVIVKVLRPGVARLVERDMETLRTLLQSYLALAPKRHQALEFMLARALDDLETAFKVETDLRNEAAALADFRRRLRRNRQVYVPEVFPQWSSSNVLVMERVEGESLAAFRARADQDPAAARRVATLAVQQVLQQVFDDGRFHGDPHAGNLILTPDGRIALIDLGLTGELGPDDRKNVAKAVKAFLSRNPESVIKALLAFGSLPEEFDYEAFKAQVVKLVEQRKTELAQQVQGQGGGGNALEGFVNALFRVAYAHRIYVPPRTTLLIKTLVTIEGVARTLNPQINLVSTALPVVVRSLRPRWLRWWRREQE